MNQIQSRPLLLLVWSPVSNLPKSWVVRSCRRVPRDELLLARLKDSQIGYHENIKHKYHCNRPRESRSCCYLARSKPLSVRTSTEFKTVRDQRHSTFIYWTMFTLVVLLTSSVRGALRGEKFTCAARLWSKVEQRSTIKEDKGIPEPTRPETR